MKKIMRICIIPAIAGFMCACDGGSDGPPPIRQGHTQAWYGRMNDAIRGPWGDLAADLIDCANEGVAGYMMELGGWERYAPEHTPESALARCREIYPKAVALARALDVTLFVSIANDNAGLGKYGDKGVEIAAQWDYYAALVDLVDAHGADGIIVQPVCETRTAGGLRLEEYAAGKLKGFALVNNGGFGRPASVAPWAKWRAMHPFVVQQIATTPTDAMLHTDTGTLIAWLNGGALIAPTDLDRLRQAAEASIAVGHPVFGYWDWKRPERNPEAIKELGRIFR
jgi:hypothetical protein